MAELDKSKMVKSDKAKETLYIDITVTADNLEDGLFQIFSQLFKGVRKDDLVFVELQGGYVNSIYCVYLKNDKNKALVFRTFGLKLNTEEFNKSLNNMKKLAEEKSSLNSAQTDQNTPDFDINTMFFNRETEYKVMNEVSKHGLCQSVYAKYNNGLCYGFSQGVILNGPLMLTNDFLNEMATKLARFHCIELNLPNIKFETHFQRMNSQFGPLIEQMVEVIQSNMDKIDEFPYNSFPKISSIAEVEQKIMSLLTEVGFGEITFCHNDSNQKNVIWNAQERTLSFIDFEMSMNNYCILEIGQLFFCYTGHFLCDFDGQFFPNTDYRKRFLKVYLKEKNRINGIQTKDDKLEEDIEKLLVQTDLATLFFFIRMILMTPFFDFQPEMFNNPELIKARENTKYFCGKFGYKIYAYFNEIKDEMIQSAEEYLKKKKSKI